MPLAEKNRSMRSNVTPQRDYHVIAVNTRGYAGSTFPPNLKEDGTYFDAVNDLQCVLDAAKVSKAVCVG